MEGKLFTETSGGGSWVNPAYDPDKDLTKLTNETLPNPENYLDPQNKSDSRPKLAELIQGKILDRASKEEEVDTRKGKVIKFGWMEGVLMRCLLNIWGTMLFLRLTWVVGQAGIWQGLLVITLCNVVTWLSALSLSAISSNGQIGAGGVYYVISRVLGPAIGGSIGLTFTIANTISVGTYTVGFAESFSDLLQDAVPGWNGIVDHGCEVGGCRDNDIRIIGGVTLCLFLFLTFAGMDWVTRVQKFLLVLLIFAQADMFLGSVLDPKSGTFYVEKNPEGVIQPLTQDQRHAYGYTGWSLETAKQNLNPSWVPGLLDNKPGFFETFGVFFTAVTGIVAGANLSGDLKDPSMAIPKGTLLSIVITYISYGFFALQTGFAFNNRASGIAEEYRSFNNRSVFRNGSGYLIQDPLYQNSSFSNISKPYIELPDWTDCSDQSNHYRDYLKVYALPNADQLNLTTFNVTNLYDKWNTQHNPEGNCTYGSGQNQMSMTYMTFTGWLSYGGCYAASLSSAIASLVGAPRILQAVGKDSIYPGVSFFEKGYNANNDPFRGYILVTMVAMGFVMLADLNSVGILASNFFLASYCLMNLSCFFAEYTKAPSWRPSFKYYNKWVSLVSALLCLALMFAMAWIYATATVICQIILFAYIYYRKPEANWGSSADALTFNSAVTNTQAVTDSPDHIKNYRPNILVLTGNPVHRPSLVDFANIITKNRSLLVCGHIIQDEGPVDILDRKERAQQWLKDRLVPGFYVAARNQQLSVGARDCMTIAGLGKLSPNMVLIGFKSNWRDDLDGNADYMEIMYSAFDLQMSFAILRCKGGLDFSYWGWGSKLDDTMVDNILQFKDKPKSGTIDVWWLFDDGGLTLLIPHIIKTRKEFKDCKIRVFFLATKSDQLDEETRNLTLMLSKFRIEYSEVIVIPLAMLSWAADDTTKADFQSMISGAGIEEADLQSEEEKTNRYLRLGEVMSHYSASSELVVSTLPLPQQGQTSPALYSAWLDSISKDLPSTVFVRGNQEPVLTFYS